MKSNHGFTMIEILLTATILALVSTPFLLALTNLGFRYRNLRYAYYAQLTAQQQIETATNIIQGANPLIFPATQARINNLFCDRIKPTGLLANACDDNILMNDILQNTYLFNFSGLTTTFYTANSSNDPNNTVNKTIEGVDFNTQIIVGPLCRLPANQYIMPSQIDGSCAPGHSSDINSMTLTINVSWNPPGPVTTTSYSISTILTEFISN